jgi:ATP adenylyltransferase
MDLLWSPWRYQYVSQASDSDSCIFCSKPARHRDREDLIVRRGRFNYVLLNLYPYTTGHLMVVPFTHVPDLQGLDADTLAEMMMLARLSEQALRQAYRPDGFNLGMNLGKAAGAGVAGHLHLHILPRWFADSNFMTTVGETRVMPEDLAATYQKLEPFFRLEA